MSTLYIRHHLELGDNLICNSIIRNYSKLYDKINLFVKPSNLYSVKFMYRDLKNIRYIVGDNDHIQKFINSNNIKNINYIIGDYDYSKKNVNNNDIKNFLIIGFKDFMRMNINFDKYFYIQANLDFEKKWSDFYIERDLISEKKLFNYLNLKEKEYIFVHDDESRGFTINNEQLPNDITIIKPDINLNYNFFDYIYIIENAKEVHCIDSSYLNLIDLLQIENDLYLHKNKRTGELNPILKSNWKIK